GELIEHARTRQEVRNRHHPSLPPPTSRYHFNVQSCDIQFSTGNNALTDDTEIG
ncbi:MAG: hypothetical protein ACI8XM_001248, partial [Haloarculaceae archaeon]